MIGPGVEVLTTVTFVADGGKTRLTVKQSTPAEPRMAKGQREGWSGSLEQLGVVLG